MAKRFTSTDIWDEDWFLEMPVPYKLFWYYVLSACDHAGLFKVNLRSFCGLNEVNIDADMALSYFNKGKVRIRVVNQSVWLIEDFFSFQYGHKINFKNPLHRGVETVLNKIGLNLTSIRGPYEESEGDKEKDKEKEIEIIKDSEESNDAELLENELIAPKMISVFRQHFPNYPIDVYADLESCLKIAHKIAVWKGWKKNSVLNGKMHDCLSEWTSIVEFVKTDKWYSQKSISFLSDKFQDLIQSKNNSNGQENGQTGTHKQAAFRPGRDSPFDKL